MHNEYLSCILIDDTVWKDRYFEQKAHNQKLETELERQEGKNKFSHGDAIYTEPV